MWILAVSKNPTDWLTATDRIIASLTALATAIAAVLIALKGLRSISKAKQDIGEREGKDQPVSEEIDDLRHDVYELGRLFGSHLYETNEPLVEWVRDREEDDE